jgi:hypothetical protein
VWTQAVKPLGPIAYIIKARVTLLRDIDAAMSPFNAFMFIGARDGGAADAPALREQRCGGPLSDEVRQGGQSDIPRADDGGVLGSGSERSNDFRSASHADMILQAWQFRRVP